MRIILDAAQNACVRKEAIHRLAAHDRQLVQERFPVGWHSIGGSGCGLIVRMRVRRKQLHTVDHPLLLVIVEPVLTRLEAGNDRMPRRRRMLRCMLARRTVAASDVPTLRTAAQMKPPTIRRRQALNASVATRSRSGINSALIFLHFDSSFRSCMSSKEFRAPAGSCRRHPFPPLREPSLPH